MAGTIVAFLMVFSNTNILTLPSEYMHLSSGSVLELLYYYIRVMNVFKTALWGAITVVVTELISFNCCPTMFLHYLNSTSYHLEAVKSAVPFEYSLSYI